MGEWFEALKTSELLDGTGKCIELGGERIAVFSVGGHYYAIDDTCTHAGAPLSEGHLKGDAVVCPWHGACFDLKTGTLLGGPSRTGVKTYPVKIEEGTVLVEV